MNPRKTVCGTIFSFLDRIDDVEIHIWARIHEFKTKKSEKWKIDANLSLISWVVLHVESSFLTVDNEYGV